MMAFPFVRKYTILQLFFANKIIRDLTNVCELLIIRGQNSLTLWNNNNLVGPVLNVKVPDIILDMAWQQWPGSSK